MSAVGLALIILPAIVGAAIIFMIYAMLHR